MGLTVDLDFPLAGRATPRQSARLITHIPVAEDGSGDIAVLALDEDPPFGAEPVRLLDVETVRGHSFRAFGFPAGDDEGVWSLGTIVDDRGRGWLQFESTSACGIRQGFSGTPLWDEHFKGVVGMVVATDGRFLQRAAYAITASVLLEVHPELRRHAAPPSPFRGLDSFREQDATHYFGRAEQIKALTDAVTTSSIIPVIGVSGVGKSSLIHAGLVPQLRKRGDYSITSLVPEPALGAELMLASALLPLLNAPDDGVDLLERLEQVERLTERLREGGTAPVVRELLTRSGTTQLALIVDQFEMLFRCSPDAAEKLVDQLVAMTGWRTADGGPLVRLVFALRLDFLKAMQRFPVLGRVCEASPVLVDRLAEDQLREVVLSPIASFHGAVRFEDSLAERLLSDAGRSPGALPLLEFTLTLLWEQQRQGILAHAAYEEIGGVAGALASHAERVVKERLGDVQDEVRRLFVQLVRPGEGGLDNPVDTGRTARRTELDPVCWKAAQLLAVQRLVHLDHASDGMETVALAHEALLEHWPALRSWVDADRDFRVWQEHVRERIVRWEQSGRDHALLMRGSELKQALEQLRDRLQDVPETERQYLKASQEWRRRQRSRKAIVAAAVTAVLGTLASFGVYSVRGSKAAELSTGLVQQAQGQADSHREKAALLSVAAWSTAPTQQAHDNLFTRYLADAPYDAILPAGGEVAETALDDSGQVIAVLNVAGRLSVWHVGAAGPSLIVRMNDVSAVAVSPDGTRLALGGDGNRIKIWDLREKRTLLTLRAATSTTSTARAVDELRFDRTGHRLVAHPPKDDRAQVWNLNRPTATPVTLKALLEGSPTDFVFSADGKHVVASGPGLLSQAVWDTRSGRLMAVPGFEEPEFVAGPRPVAAMCADGKWRLTHASANKPDPRLFQRLPCSTEDVTIGELAGISDQVVLTRDDGAVTVHDAATGQRLLVLAEDGTKGRYARYVLAGASRRIAFARGTEVLVATAPAPGSLPTADIFSTGNDEEAAHFSPSGRYLVTVGAGGEVALWDPATGRRIAAKGRGGYQATYTRLAFDAEEKTLAVSEGPAESVTLYKLPSLEVLRRIRVDRPLGSAPQDAELRNLGFTRHGRLVTLVGGAVSQWDVTAGRKVAETLLFRENSEVDRNRYATNLTADPASERIAVTTPDLRGVEIWDLRDRRRVTVVTPGFRAPLADRDAVHFSSDGRRLLLTGKDGSAEVWDTKGQRRETTIPPDGTRTTRFLSNSAETVSVRRGIVERWGPGGLIAQTRIPAAAHVRTVVPSPDGEHLLLSVPVSTSQGTDTDFGTTAAFQLRQASATNWAAELCSHVTRNISQEDLNTMRYGMLERVLLGVTACSER